MKQYVDKNDKIVQEGDYILVDEKVCQALRYNDGMKQFED